MRVLDVQFCTASVLGLLHVSEVEIRRALHVGTIRALHAVAGVSLWSLSFLPFNDFAADVTSMK